MPENPARNLGNNTIIELNNAYWVAENATLVKLDINVIKAAVAIPAPRLSAEITRDRKSVV